MIFAFIIGAVLFFWFIGSVVHGDVSAGCVWPVAIAGIGFVLFFLFVVGILVKG